MRRGVVFCHGHFYETQESTSLPQYYRNLTNNWIFIDIDSRYNPDIVGSYDSVTTLDELGYDKYDYAVLLHCPMISLNFVYNCSYAMTKIRPILKQDGRLYFNAYIDYLDRYYSYLLDETIHGGPYNNKFQQASDQERTMFRKIHENYLINGLNNRNEHLVAMVVSITHTIQLVSNMSDWFTIRNNKLLINYQPHDREDSVNKLEKTIYFIK